MTTTPTTPTTPPAAPRLQAQARECFYGPAGWHCAVIETATGQDLSSCDKTHRTESGARTCARRQLQALGAQRASECWYCRQPYAAGATSCSDCQRAELTAADWAVR